MADTSAISPLSGGYLLIVLTEPHSEQHKQVLLERLAKGQFVVVIRFFSPVVIARAAESAKWWRWLQLRSRSPKFSGRCLSPPMCSFVIVLFFSRKKRERDPSPQYPSRPVGRGYNHRRRVTLG